MQPDLELQIVLDWCSSVLGPAPPASDHTREHPGERAAAHRLHTTSGYCYVKIHHDRSHWESEVHGYERWAPAFGDRAPKLLAVHAEEPLALVISELPGRVLEEVQLTASQEREVWRSAGEGLARLHALEVGECFGPCRRDGTCIGIPITDAQEHVTANLEEWLDRGLRIDCLSHDEQALLNAVRGLIPAFAGERPLPCHRDYCSANWLVTPEGQWAGVIDFEFSYWDVRVADFTRHPDWRWIDRPDLAESFFAGYGRTFTPREEQQILVGHALYALSAVVWGMENAYYGFANDGRQAFKHLAGLIG